MSKGNCDGVARLIAKEFATTEDESKSIIEKARIGGEIEETDIGGKKWAEERLFPNCSFVDENEYAEMCIDALKTVGSIAATDFGGSRQRDLGQMWADMTRGYLGELAFSKFLAKNGFEAKLGHEKGSMSDYLDSDILKIKNISAGELDYREPKLKIGIKTTKWNGIWLDIPGDQFAHSDVHVLVKIGIGRDHLFAFFKKISVFRDKILRKGMDIGCLDEKQSEEIYRGLPEFHRIPTYICGFVLKDTHYSELPYSGKMGRIHFTVKSWNGPIKNGDLSKVKEKEKVPGTVSFEGIGNFSHEGYLFNTGKLLWKNEVWKREVFDRL